MATEARLRAFLAVAETGSVRAAAERLVVTESAVSAAVTALTAEVGVPLAERHGRGLRLTAGCIPSPGTRGPSSACSRRLSPPPAATAIPGTDDCGSRQ